MTWLCEAVSAGPLSTATKPQGKRPDLVDVLTGALGNRSVPIASKVGSLMDLHYGALDA